MKRINVISCQLVKEGAMPYETKIITSPRTCALIFREFIGNTDREHFVIACLNTKNNVVALHTVSIGCLNATIIHPREIFKAAILANAARIICCHNHPSGDTTPSKEDYKVTENLVEAGKLLDIPVIDHVILGDDGDYFSFKQEGIHV